METQIYDAIIIGAGPAGTSAAYHLAKTGMKTLILEKSIFPRRKPCGGGFTHRALLEIPFDISPVIQKTVVKGYLNFHGQTLGVVNSDLPISYLVDRMELDPFLLNAAKKMGAHAKLGERVHSCHEMEDRVIVHTTHKTYQARYLVGADGVHSLIAQTFKLIPDRETSLCYEALLSLPKETNGTLEAVHFDFGTLLFGYGWIFPKQSHLNIGVFRSWPGRKVGKHQLFRYIRQHPNLHESSLINIRAYPIPLGGKPCQRHTRRIALIGDAANLADPWLGEGIYYALASGRMAAEAILQCEREKLPDLSHYSRQVNEKLSNQLNDARKLSLLVHSLPLINVLILNRSKTLQRIIIDLFRGTRTYADIWQELKTRFPHLVLQIIQGK